MRLQHRHRPLQRAAGRLRLGGRCIRRSGLRQSSPSRLTGCGRQEPASRRRRPATVRHIPAGHVVRPLWHVDRPVAFAVRAVVADPLLTFSSPIWRPQSSHPTSKLSRGRGPVPKQQAPDFGSGRILLQGQWNGLIGSSSGDASAGPVAPITPAITSLIVPEQAKPHLSGRICCRIFTNPPKRRVAPGGMRVDELLAPSQIRPN